MCYYKIRVEKGIMFLQDKGGEGCVTTRCTLKCLGTTVCQSCATHRALIAYMSCATWYKGTAQLVCLTELKLLLF